MAERCELVLNRHESRSADCTAGLYDMLVGLAGPEDVEENDDFPDMPPPSTRCESSDGLSGCALENGKPVWVYDAGLKGGLPLEVASSGLLSLVLRADARGPNLSLPG